MMSPWVWDPRSTRINKKQRAAWPILPAAIDDSDDDDDDDDDDADYYYHYYYGDGGGGGFHVEICVISSRIAVAIPIARPEKSVNGGRFSRMGIGASSSQPQP